MDKPTGPRITAALSEGLRARQTQCDRMVGGGRNDERPNSFGSSIRSRKTFTSTDLANRSNPSKIP